MTPIDEKKVWGGMKGNGKTFAAFCAFQDAIKAGKTAEFHHPEYIVMSRNRFEELINPIAREAAMVAKLAIAVKALEELNICDCRTSGMGGPVKCHQPLCAKTIVKEALKQISEAGGSDESDKKAG